MKLNLQLLQELNQKYGESFYILYPDRFQSNYSEFLGAFRKKYPKTNFAYSYKTNYTPILCQIVNIMGGYAEVVSRMEYELAIEIGVPGEKIIFNGPYKRKSDIEHAVHKGSIINLDSSYEVDIVEFLAKKNPDTTITVGIRCNLDYGSEFVSRFGFDVDSKEFYSAFEKLNEIENCQIGGLHCHFIIPGRKPEDYAAVARKMLQLSTTHFGDNHPKFIDLGGGFYSKMSSELEQQFGHAIPSYQDYAEAIGTEFANFYPQDTGPELILEPGISITADIMQFVAKIIDIKRIRSRTIALTSGSIYNVKPTLNTKNLPTHIVSAHPDPVEKQALDSIDIVGYTCMENDCLYQGFKGNLNIGDYVVFDSVGAYTIVLKPPFISPSPAIIAYDQKSGEVDVIKRRENFSDVFSNFVF